MVATCVPVLNLHDEGGLRVGVRNRNDAADLGDRPRFESNVGEALSVEVTDQLPCLL